MKYMYIEKIKSPHPSLSKFHVLAHWASSRSIVKMRASCFTC